MLPPLRPLSITFNFHADSNLEEEGMRRVSIHTYTQYTARGALKFDTRVLGSGHCVLVTMTFGEMKTSVL